MLVWVYVIFKIEIGILLAIYLFANISMAKNCDANNMKEILITEKCLVSKIFASIIYSLAWLLKGIEIVVNKCIAQKGKHK